MVTYHPIILMKVKKARNNGTLEHHLHRARNSFPPILNQIYSKAKTTAFLSKSSTYTDST